MKTLYDLGNNEAQRAQKMLCAFCALCGKKLLGAECFYRID